MRALFIALVISVTAAAQSAGAQGNGTTAMMPGSSPARGMADPAHAMPYIEPVPHGQRPAPDVPVSSPSMEPHVPGIIPGTPGNEGPNMIQNAHPLPMPMPQPQFDHCQLLQVHFPDWRSDPRMKAYMTTYCLSRQFKELPGKFVPGKGMQ